jgi:hypothetical protein
MELLSVCATIITTMFTMTNAFNLYERYKIDLAKYINDAVADSVEYTYIVYVKNKKTNDEFDSNAQDEALNIAKKRFKDISYTNISDDRLTRLIKDRILYIKSKNTNPTV